MTWGTISTSIIRLKRVGRFRLVGEARGHLSGFTSLRFVQNPHLACTYDATDGHVTSGTTGVLARVEVSDGVATPGGMDDVGARVTSPVSAAYLREAEEIFIELQQFIEAAASDLTYGYVAWGYPPDPANLVSLGDSPRWASVVIEEANS
jgi:hypothetical protein